MSCFKLKDVVETLCKHGLLQIGYDPEKLGCMNGLEASRLGLAYYRIRNELIRNPMPEIIEYNQIDCLVLYHILRLLVL